MIMRLKGFYFFVVVGAFLLTALGFYLKNKQPAEVPVEITPPEVVDRLVEQQWVSFAVPQVVTQPEFEIPLKLLQPFDRIEVLWTHSMIKSEPYVLKNFQPGSPDALYKIGAFLGNLLPGDNTYEIFGIREAGDPAAPQEALRVSFSLVFDLKQYSEIGPEFFTFAPLPAETDVPVLVRGNLQAPVQHIQVYSFAPRTKLTSFARLNKYDPTKTGFEYRIDESLGNFSIGDNEYVVEALDDAGKVLARKYFSIRSSKLTLQDEVKNLFGEFTMVNGGWFVSSALPWFSLRPVYDSIWISEEQGKVVVPRPTLLYTTESTLSQPLCDYLKNIDYEQENYSYRGYSYEICQRYRFGVSVYDRFLSILEYQPFQLVKRTDYKNLSDKASSAFVMIETGGMKAVDATLSFQDDAFSEVEEVEELDDVEEKPAPKYYLYQMMITDEVPYGDKKIGEIQIEVSSEQQQQIETVRAFLGRHSGDELFSKLLFPASEESSDRQM